MELAMSGEIGLILIRYTGKKEGGGGEGEGGKENRNKNKVEKREKSKKVIWSVL